MFFNTLLPASLHREIARSFAQPSVATPSIGHLIRGEVIEREHHWELNLDLPGLDREDVEILVEGNELVIKGVHNREALGERDRVEYSSRLFGSFERRYRLSDEINLEKVSAHMDKGVLRIILSKADQALPRKVDIQISGASSSS
ncbi:MAG: Hsp20/alpha crystallin family protein [bacterium]|jgi:HSP20 family protein|nr:Hsp20/alpha crystallin family protein [bacterium]